MEICYLIAFPDSNEGKTPAPEQFKVLKDAPYFQPIDIDLLSLGEETIVIEGYAVSVTRQLYDNRVQMVECHFDLSDPFAPSVLQTRRKLQSALQSRYIPETFRQSGLFEDYSILLAQNVKPTPDKWIEKNRLAISTFIRLQREALDEKEIREILTSRTKYSATELTLIDWEGAVIIAPNGDYHSDIALLKIGNYQLLRYRMLDQSIENMLDKINESFFKNKKRLRATKGMVRQIAEHRLEVMLDFERAEQNLLLIGDWYTAKLYEAIQSEFYLRDWKDIIKSKIENLEDILQTVKDNFLLSYENLMDQLQLWGWVILLLGYFYLYALDAGWLKLP